MTTTVKGAKELQATLKRLGARAPHAIASGLYMAGNVVITDAKRRTPVDYDTLRSSGYVTLPEVVGQSLVVEIGFGGSAKDYAVVQHENENFKHEVGEAKFLLNALNANTQIVTTMVTAAAKHALANPDFGGVPLVMTTPTEPE